MTAVAAPPLFSVSEILRATSGRLAAGPAAGGAASVAIDSRQVRPGALFVALRGERTDGHAFLREAVAAGAGAVLVSEAQAARRAGELAALGVAAIAVPEVLAAVQALARFHLARLPLAARIGVTGSSGKTTTKEILGSILSRAAPTAVNEGNLNSETGLPLACFAVTAAHRWVVLEMAVNHPGEMAPLAEIVRPDLAIVTNVGTAHIGLLGSREAIAREKRLIFSRFTGGEVALLPEDEEFLGVLAEGVRGRVVTFGPRSTPGFRGAESLGLDGTLIHWEGFQVRFPLFGAHNLANALAAVTAARELAVAPAVIRDGLEAVEPLFGRSQILRAAHTVIFDGYNANPDSMEQAIAFAASVDWEGRRVAVLGGMRELGPESREAHRALAARLARSPFDLVFLLGEELREAAGVLGRQLPAGHVAWEETPEALGRRIAAAVRPGDLVLVKGSRGLELERVLPFLGVGEGDASARLQRKGAASRCS
jgi:UDP-N-acetylmuramoyl-tripeptide--D-alanyl-D-alanine ligase